MNRQAFLKEILSGVLSGALDLRAVPVVLAARLPARARSVSEDLLAGCETALRHLGEWERHTTLLELRYYWECLAENRVFDPREVDLIRRDASLVVNVCVVDGVFARVTRYPRHRGIVLVTTSPSTLAQLRRLERTCEFGAVLRWVRAHTAIVGGSPYYLVRPDRLPGYLRELRLFLQSRFSTLL